MSDEDYGMQTGSMAAEESQMTTPITQDHVRQKRVYVVLVNWNGWRDTIECLESVFHLNYADFTVVVCDNDSRDDSLERIREWARGQRIANPCNPGLAHLVNPPIGKPVKWAEYDRAHAERGGNLAQHYPLVLIQTGANLGFAGGNNVGFRYALARGDVDFVWALNNDTVVAPDSLSKLVARFAASSDVGLCGSTVCFATAPDQVQVFGGAHYNKWLGQVRCLGLGIAVPADLQQQREAVERDLSYVLGASMLASRRFLQEVGLMQEDYFLFFEELDWAMRARQKGFRLGYAPLSRVYHKAGAVTGSAQESPLSLYLINRNRLRFARRFYPLLVPLHWLCLALQLGKAVFRQRRNKITPIAAALFGVRCFRTETALAGARSSQEDSGCQ